MNPRKFSAAGRTTIGWTSGTSTEIFIHPPGADFQSRNFLFRISTATVEAEESTFTFFEGITRHLMILKGELELIHEGRYTKHLRPFQQDTFSGEWKTRSRGKVTDFNLMLKGGTSGFLKHHHLDVKTEFDLSPAGRFHFVYLVSGTALSDNGELLVQGDLLRLEKSASIVIRANEPCDLIEIEVTLKAE